MHACFKFPKYTAQMGAGQRDLQATGGSWGKASPQEKSHQLIQFQTISP